MLLNGARQARVLQLVCSSLMASVFRLCLAVAAAWAATAVSVSGPQLRTHPLDKGVNSLAVDERRQKVYYSSDSPPSSIIRVDVMTYQREDTVVCDPEDGNLWTSVLDVDADVLYFPTSGNRVSAPSVLLTLNLSTFSRAASTPLSQPGQFHEIHAAVLDPVARQIHVADYLSPSVVLKFDLATQKVAQRITLSDENSGILAGALDATGRWLYLGQYTGSAAIVRIATADYSVTGRFPLPGAGAGVTALFVAADLQRLYVTVMASAEAPGAVHALGLDDLAWLGSLAVLPSERSPAAGAADVTTGFGYAATVSIPSTVIKFDLNTMQRVDTLTLSNDEDQSDTMALDTASGQLHVGCSGSPARIARVDLRSFSRSAVVETYPQSPLGGLLTLVVDERADTAYVVSHLIPTLIGQISLPDLTLLRVMRLNAGEEEVYSGLVDNAADFLYLACSTVILRISTRDLSRAGTIPLANELQNPMTSTFGATTDVAYFGCNSAPGAVVKVDLRRFILAASVVLEFGEDYVRSCAFDAVRHQLLCVLASSPSRLIRLREDTLAYAGPPLSLPAVDKATVLLMGPPGVAYITSYAAPPVVVSVILDAFEIVGSNSELTTNFHGVTNGYFDTSVPGGGQLVFAVQASPDPMLWALYASNLSRVGEATALGDGSGVSLYALVALSYVSKHSCGLFGGFASPPRLAWACRSGAGVLATGELVDHSGDGYFATRVVELQKYSEEANLGIAFSYGGHAFFAGGAQGGTLTRVRWSDFSHAGSLIVSDSAQIGSSVQDGPFAYVGVIASPALLMMVDLASMRVVDRLAYGIPGLGSGAQDPASRLLYFASVLAPAVIVCVRANPASPMPGAGLAHQAARVMPSSAGLGPFTSAVVYGFFVFFGTCGSLPELARLSLYNPQSGSGLAYTGRIYLHYQHGCASTVIQRPGTPMAFFGLQSSPGVIAQVDLAGFTVVSRLPLQHPYVLSAALCVGTPYGIFSAGSGPGFLVRVNLDTFAEEASLSMPSNMIAVNPSVVCDTAINATGRVFASLLISPTQIISVDAELLAVAGITASLVLPPGAGEGWLRAAVAFTAPVAAFRGVDGPVPEAVYAVYGTFTSPGALIRVRVGDMQRLDSLRLGAGEGRLAAIAVDAASGYAFAVGEGIIMSVAVGSTAPMQVVQRAKVSPPGLRLLWVVLDADTQMLYAGGGGQPGRVLRMRLAPGGRMEPAGNATLPSGSDEPSCAVSVASQNALFVGTATAPGTVVQLMMQRLEPVRSLSLPAGVDYLISAAINHRTGVGYFGTGTTPGSVAVVDLTGLQLLRVLLMQSREVAARLLVIDVTAGMLYGATNTDPTTLIQLSLSDGSRLASVRLPQYSGRPASLVLEPTSGALLVASDAVPSQLFKLEATPSRPAITSIQSSRDGIELMRPSLQLCSMLLGEQDYCIAEGPVLTFSGAFFGSFVVPARATIDLVPTAVLHLGAEGVWTASSSVAIPAATVSCANISCSSGSTCSCSAALSDVRVSGAPLTAVVYLVHVSVGETAADARQLAVFVGAPSILRVQPTVIAEHDAVLTVDLALAEPFNSSLHELVLTSGSAEYACLLSNQPSTNAQQIRCAPPPLSFRMLGHAFDLELRRLNSTLCRSAAAVRYAWPVIAAIEPSVGFPLIAAPAGSPLLLQSSVFMGRSVLDAPDNQLAVRVGASACANVSWVSRQAGTLRCTPPSAVGVSVVVTVVVDGIINVTSYEAVPAGEVFSPYDGTYSTAFDAPKLGSRTTLSYAQPTILAVAPQRFALRSLEELPEVHNLSIFLSTPMTTAGVRIVAMLGAGSTAVSIPCGSAASSRAGTAFADTLVCPLLAGALRAALALLPSEELLGTHDVALTAALQMTAWPDDTAVRLVAPAPLRVIGTPFVSDIEPNSAREGAGITITGLGFLQLGTETDATISVTVGSASCSAVVVASDTELRCTLPPYNATGAGSDAAFVRVATAGGVSAAYRFHFLLDLQTDWAQGSGGGAGGGISLYGVTPMLPVPAIKVIRGTAIRCSLALVDADTPAKVSLAGRSTALLDDNAAGDGQTAVFADVAVLPGAVTSAERIFLTGACSDAEGRQQDVPRRGEWTVALPTLQWTTDTLVAAKELVTPDALPLALHAYACIPAANDTLPGTSLVMVALQCSASLLHGAETISATSSAVMDVGWTARGTQACSILSFQGVDLRHAPFGSLVLAQAGCRWMPSGAVISLPQLTLAVLPAAVVWTQRPPAIVESQALVQPHVSVSLTFDADAAPASLHALSLTCTLSAVLVSAVDDSGVENLATGLNASAVASIVVPQTVTAAWNDTIAFEQFSVAGPRLARYNATVACTLGAQSLPVLWAPLQIAGCPAGAEPGGSTKCCATTVRLARIQMAARCAVEVVRWQVPRAEGVCSHCSSDFTGLHHRRRFLSAHSRSSTRASTARLAASTPQTAHFRAHVGMVALCAACASPDTLCLGKAAQRAGRQLPLSRCSLSWWPCSWPQWYGSQSGTGLGHVPVRQSLCVNCSASCRWSAS